MPENDQGVNKVSTAEQHRRRRLIAALVSGGVIALAIILLAVTAGSAGTWDPTGLRDGAKTELPKLRLEAQARAAARQIARQKAQREAENVAIDKTLQANPVLTRGGSARKEVALTFDDGPSAYTGQVLEALKRNRAHATFFVLGNQLNGFPLQLQQILADGNAVGSHSWNHADFTTLSAGDMRGQFSDTSGTLVSKGVPAPKLFRPPYGAFNQQVVAEAQKKGMLTVLWDVDTNDYTQPTPQQIAQTVASNVQDGSIVLMHDGGGPRASTVAAVPLIIKELRKRGFDMVTIPQLLLDNPPSADQQVDVQRTPVA